MSIRVNLAISSHFFFGLQTDRCCCCCCSLPAVHILLPKTVLSVLSCTTKRTKRKKKNVLSFSTNPFYVSQSADLAVNYRGPYGSPIVDPIQLALNLLLEFKKALQLLSDFLLINTTTKVQKYQTQVLN